MLAAKSFLYKETPVTIVVENLSSVIDIGGKRVVYNITDINRLQNIAEVLVDNEKNNGVIHNIMY